MTAIVTVQLMLSAAGMAIAARSLQRLFFASALDTRRYLEGLSVALAADASKAARFVRASPFAAVARLSQACVLEASHGGDSEVLLSELRHEAVGGIGALRTLGRMASPLAFIGVMVELGLAFAGGRGIDGLQRGLSERLAIEHAALGLAIGMATSIVCLSVATTLQEGARKRLSDLRLTLEIIDTARQSRAET